MRAARSLGGCLLIALGWSSLRPAAAQDMAVFDLPLGTRFEVPECEKAVLGNVTVYQAAATVCFERLGSQDAVRDTSPIENGSILIRYPGNEAPAVMSGGRAVGVIRSGNLQGVRFNTRGVDVQDQVLAVLTEKFGKPGSVVPKQVQNTLGATYDVFDAHWTLPQADVLFRSVTSRVDTGFLGVDLKTPVDPTGSVEKVPVPTSEPARN